MEATHGLPLTSYEVLIQLADAPDHRMRMCDLADSVLLSRSGMSRLVDRLERDGLLCRAACTNDARGAFACVTQAGLELLEQARPTHVAGIRRRFLAQFSEDELGLFGEYWDRLVPSTADGAAPRLAASSEFDVRVYVFTPASSPLARSRGRYRALVSRRTAARARVRRRARALLDIRTADAGVARPRGRPAASRTARCARRPSCRWPRRRVVKALEPREVAAARLRHGARQHVPPVPHARPRADRAARRAARVHGLDAADRSPTPAASRSSRWATAPWPTRSRAARRSGGRARRARSSRSTRRACASAPTSTAASASWRPETSMEVQAALGSDIALAFDECTPFHVDRDYTARSTERTHRWLDRCLRLARAQHGPAGQARLRDRAGRRVRGPAPRVRRRRSPRAAADGIAIGGSLGAGEGADVRGRRAGRLRELAGARPPAPPAGHRRGRRPRARRRARASTRFDCAMPTRLGRHGIALVPDPERRWRVDLARRAGARPTSRCMEGCPCPACAAGYSRALPALPVQARAS